MIWIAITKNIHSQCATAANFCWQCGHKVDTENCCLITPSYWFRCINGVNAAITTLLGVREMAFLQTENCQFLWILM